MLFIIRYKMINYLSNYLNNLYVYFFKQETQIDFIERLNKNGCYCYLTGNSLTSLILNDNKIYDKDIYVENMNIFELYSILNNYGFVYYYGGKNINNLRLILHPFNSNVKYEFTNNYDYGSTFNSLRYKINNLNDTNVLNINKIVESDIFKLYDIRNKVWKNVNELEYFSSLENIMRCFSLSSRFNLNITDKTLLNIKNSIDKGFKNSNYTIIFNEFHKITLGENCVKYLKHLHSCGILKLLNMNYDNFDDVLKIIKNKYHLTIGSEEVMLILLAYMNVVDIEKWADDIMLYSASCFNNSYKETILKIKYYKEFKNIKNRIDMLLFINKLNDNNFYNRGINFNCMSVSIIPSFLDFCLTIDITELNSDMYYLILNECSQYPLSINELSIKGDDLVGIGINIFEINNTKKKLLNLIYNDEISNTKSLLIKYIDENDEIFLKNYKTE